MLQTAGNYPIFLYYKNDPSYKINTRLCDSLGINALVRFITYSSLPRHQRDPSVEFWTHFFSVSYIKHTHHTSCEALLIWLRSEPLFLVFPPWLSLFSSLLLIFCVPTMALVHQHAWLWIHQSYPSYQSYDPDLFSVSDFWIARFTFKPKRQASTLPRFVCFFEKCLNK